MTERMKNIPIRRIILAVMVVAALGLTYALLTSLKRCDHAFVWHDVPTKWLDTKELINEDGDVTDKEVVSRQFLDFSRCPQTAFEVGDIVYVDDVGVARITELFMGDDLLVTETTNGEMELIHRSAIRARD